MPLRRRAWLSREGLYYCGVLGFIIGGAVLRSINLLVVLAGIMIAPLLLNWRMVMASLRGLVVTRRLPEQVCAGEELTVEITVENTRRWKTSLLLVIDDWIERVEGPAARGQAARGQAARGQGTGDRGQKTIGVSATTHHSPLTTHSPPPNTKHESFLGQLRGLYSRLRHAHILKAEALVAQVPPLSTATTTYRIKLPQRGIHRFGPLRVATRYPLGLVCGHFTLPAPAELIVGPRLGRLSPEWANLLAADNSGDQHRHPQRGVSEGDYYGLRPWQSGDSTRWIHWRTTAKLGTPTVLQFERQRNREVAIVLDAYLPSGHHAGEAEREAVGLLELAISLVATAVADLTHRGHSRLTVGVGLATPAVWTGPTSPLFCQEVLAELAVLSGTTRPALERTLAQVHDEAASGSRVIVISPRSARAAEFTPGDETVWIDVRDPELAGLFTFE